MNTEAVLDIVKDASQFEDKIKQLAKAEKASKDAATKARAAQKEMAQAVDDGRAELAELHQKNQTAVANSMKPIDQANAALAKREGELNKNAAEFEKAAERLASGQAVLKAGREDLKAERVAFQERVDTFAKAAAALAERA